MTDRCWECAHTGCAWPGFWAFATSHLPSWVPDHRFQIETWPSQQGTGLGLSRRRVKSTPGEASAKKVCMCVWGVQSCVRAHVYARMGVFEDAHKPVNLRVHVCKDTWYENVKVQLWVRICVLVHLAIPPWCGVPGISQHLLQTF